MLKFYTTENFGLFWAPSLVTLLTFQNVINPTLNTLSTLNTLKHPLNSLRPATFSPNNTDSFFFLFPLVLLFGCLPSVPEKSVDHRH